MKKRSKINKMYPSDVFYFVLFLGCLLWFVFGPPFLWS